MDYKIKDVVTKANIRQDIRYFYFGGTFAIVFTLCFTISLFVSVWGFIGWNIEFIRDNFFGKVFIILIIITVLFCATYLIYNVYGYIKARKAYTIMIDKLVGNYRWFNPKHGLSLRFATYGRYNIAYGKRYYPWAEYYSMTGDKVVEMGFGEEFYVVVVNKRIVSIYSKKMFELSEEIEIMM